MTIDSSKILSPQTQTLDDGFQLSQLNSKEQANRALKEFIDQKHIRFDQQRPRTAARLHQMSTQPDIYKPHQTIETQATKKSSNFL